MVKKITKKAVDGILRNNTKTGVVTATFATATIPVNSKDIDSVYFNYVKPFIDKSPLYIGSIDDLLPIYESINKELKLISNGKVKNVLLVFRDMLTVIVRAQQDYFNFIRISNELEEIKVNYRLSQQTVDDLTQKIILLEQDDDEKRVGILQGTLGIKLKKIRPLIYAQAILNLDLAWYKYLHNYAKFDTALFISTKNYVRSLGTKEEAYNELIRLLDEKYKTILEDVDD